MELNNTSEKIVDSVKDVSSEWLMRNIYKPLNDLEVCERLMINGCESIIEYAENLQYLNENQLTQIQHKNMGVMIEEFKILLTNAKSLFGDLYEKFMTRLTRINKIYLEGLDVDGKNIKTLSYVHKIKKSTCFFKLTSLFYILSRDLCELRKEIVVTLSPLLISKQSASRGM